MQIKTILGASIQEALAQARALLGDGVVLLESVPPHEGAPARITVMVDAAAAPAPSEVEAAPAFAGFGYGGARPARPSAAEPAAATLSAPYASAAPADTQVAAPFSAASPAPFMPAVRTPLFTPPPAAPLAPPPASPVDADALARQIEARLAARFDGLTERLATIERQSQQRAAEAPGEWAAHPAWAALLRSGLSPATAAALFRAAAERGLRPDAEADAVHWALAGALRDRLAPTAPPRYAAPALAVVGPAGAGKTGLLLKLAADARYFGHRRPAVLVVTGDELAPDPTPLYHRHGLPVRTVATPDEVRDALDRTREFDGLLIDTPALPAAPEAARRALDRLRTLLAPVAPLDVVLALDATRERPSLDGRALAALPLAPTAVALTHLDEVEGWGRVADHVLDLGLPVPFAVTGAERAGTLAPYSPGWFAEALARQWAEAAA